MEVKVILELDPLGWASYGLVSVSPYVGCNEVIGYTGFNLLHVTEPLITYNS